MKLLNLDSENAKLDEIKGENTHLKTMKWNLFAANALDVHLFGCVEVVSSDRLAAVRIPSDLNHPIE